MRSLVLSMVVFFLCGTFQVHSQLRFTEIREDVTHFGEKLNRLDFSQYIFHGRFNLASSKVNEASFNLTEFKKIGDFGSTSFLGRADIDNATFDGLANFLRAEFHGRANFMGTVFADELIFEGSIFADDALFVNTEFDGYSNFLITKFLGYTEFSGSQFRGRTSFSNSLFARGASFKGVSIQGDMIFSNAVFLDDIDFSNVTNIKNRVDLTVVNTDTIKDGEKIRRGINLTNSDIGKFKIDYSLFYLKFDSSATFEYRSNAYQSLLNTFKTDGYTESYEILDKEYRNFVYDKKNAWLMNFIDKYWWDYGYSKYFIFYWTFGLLATFTLLNFFFYKFLQEEVYSVNDVESKFKSTLPLIPLRRLYYALVYTSVLFFSLSVKLDNLRYKYWFGVAYVFIIYMLGIICLAYAANFVLQ